MELQDKPLTEKESLDLITQMINKAKDACHDTGIAAIMWGAVIAVCALVKLSEIHFNYRLPFNIYWLTFAAVIPQIYFSIRAKRERKVKAYGDEFMDYLWVGFGICIFLMIYVTGSMYNEWKPVADEYYKLAGHSSSFKFYEFNSSLFLLLYGLPTFVTGVSMKFKPMFWGGLLCWVCCITALYTPVKIDLILLALSSIFAWLIPGIIMEKDYRKAKKELAQANV
ncbi:MAG: hypothetical protein JNM19_10355 [Chitinophagaceae bacterium]|nr:hypothetical protein [Chitinophagaceae bacterium]